MVTRELTVNVPRSLAAINAKVPALFVPHANAAERPRILHPLYSQPEHMAGGIEVAQRMAGHSDAKTTGLYDRRNDISIGEVERIGI
jgi:hypothetical protein